MSGHGGWIGGGDAHAGGGGADSRMRALEFCADRALGELDDDGAQELDRLLCDHPDLDNDRLELTAAALLLAAPPLPEDAAQVPEALLRRCAESGRRWVQSHPASATGARAGEPDPWRLRLDPDSTRRGGQRLGWLAAAAALGVAALAWWPRLSMVSAPGGGDARLSPAVLRDELLRKAPDLVRWNWTAIPHERCGAATGGDVVWSSDRQEGYMRIDGLQPNDPKLSQYQLWIFDKTRDDRYPVDGGVFDVPPGQHEVVVPIRAPIDVREPFQFAVTVEPPGGVVVSARDLVLLAKP